MTISLTDPFMKKLWFILLIGCLCLAIGEIVSKTLPHFSDGRIIRSFSSSTVDWKVEYAMIAGTLAVAIFVIGLVAVVYASLCLALSDGQRRGRKGIAILLFIITSGYCCLALYEMLIG
jgi:glucose uptake protein GlcU